AVLRGFLQERLPDYMVPSAFLAIDAMPLTPNGKIDRKALPKPGSQESSAALEVAPQTSSERLLASVWCDVLHLQRVGINANFFELGGDSLATLQVVGQARRLGLRLTPKMLFQHQTIAALAAAAEEPAAGPEAEESRIVPLGTAMEGPAIFFLPPWGGGVGAYTQLAKELASMRSFGLQAVSARGRGPEDTVERIARSYLRDVRRIQPQGPYRLGGWSMAGWVALEMARLLESEGEAVELLALLDPTPDPGNARLAESMGTLLPTLRQAAETAQSLADMPVGARPPEMAARLAKQLAEAGLDDPSERSPSEILDHLLVLQGQTLAAMDYRPGTRPYGGPVAAFVSEGTAAATPTAEQSIHQLLARPVVVLRVAGDHKSMMTDPANAAVLAVVLAATLAEAGRRAGP
ncbi:MAG: thioesterase domain-containing protein, partial [Thermoplasmatota archaeon]